jgi:hypothetical protein
MAKFGIKSADAGRVLNQGKFGGWSLCIGAGTSLPLFPTWQELVQGLLTSGPNALSPPDAKSLRDSFPPEALIRASQELLALDDEKFREYLTDTLYSHLRSEASGSWLTIARCLMARVPGNVLASEWEQFWSFISSRHTTSAELAEVILESVEKEKAPNAILSFNAEPLLFSLINAQAALRFRARKRIPKEDDMQSGPGVVDRIEGSTSWAKKGRIPYYFCHGFLPIVLTRSEAPWGEPSAAIESKMVFSESDYLSLANMVLSWQSSVFIRSAMSDRTVFVGLSLTDPNMRRWLAWLYSQRLHEIQARNPRVRDSTQHLWINRTSGSPQTDRWTEALVSNLGVRLVWIDQWRDTAAILREMLALM